MARADWRVDPIRLLDLIDPGRPFCTRLSLTQLKGGTQNAGTYLKILLCDLELYQISLVRGRTNACFLKRERSAPSLISTGQCKDLCGCSQQKYRPIVPTAMCPRLYMTWVGLHVS